MQVLFGVIVAYNSNQHHHKGNSGMLCIVLVAATGLAAVLDVGLLKPVTTDQPTRTPFAVAGPYPFV